MQRVTPRQVFEALRNSALSRLLSQYPEWCSARMLALTYQEKPEEIHRRMVIFFTQQITSTTSEAEIAEIVATKCSVMQPDSGSPVLVIHEDYVDFLGLTAIDINSGTDRTLLRIVAKISLSQSWYKQHEEALLAKLKGHAKEPDLPEEEVREAMVSVVPHIISLNVAMNKVIGIYSSRRVGFASELREALGSECAKINGTCYITQVGYKKLPELIKQLNTRDTLTR